MGEWADMLFPEPTYTIPKAQYDHMQERITELEALAEEHDAQIRALGDQLAEAWEEGRRYGISASAQDPVRDNPYREA